MQYEEEKRRVAEKAVHFIKPGMKIGVGTGSTASFFIDALKKRHAREKLQISCIATSQQSQRLLGNAFALVNDALASEIDITFDGADRINPHTFHLIKGGGGALLREKLVALSSKRNIVLVDFSKVTSPLQGFPVAVEIVPFGFAATLRRMQTAGYEGSLRPALSDNGNRLFDIHFKEPILEPQIHHDILKGIVGVIETGFFLHTATEVLIGTKEGDIIHLVNNSKETYL